jgi:hypothetical protein
VGEYAGGKREGLGYMILPDGGLYEGHFKSDKFEGQGQYTYPDGSVYTGSWEGGLKHGPGVYWDTVKGCLRGAWVKVGGWGVQARGAGAGGQSWRGGGAKGGF